MTCYVFGAAPVPDASFIQVKPQDGDLVICADGGYRLALSIGIRPDWVVGDFDSNGGAPDFPNLIRVNPQKDDTDLNLAVEHGVSLGYRDFEIYGVLGGRFDHSIAAVQMLAEKRKQGITIRLLDSQNEVRAVSDETVEFSKGGYRYFSVLSLTEKSTGVTIRGAAYPLEDAVLAYDFPLGVSNELLAEKGSVTVEKGTVLLIFSKDMNQDRQTSIG